MVLAPVFLIFFPYQSKNLILSGSHSLISLKKRKKVVYEKIRHVALCLCAYLDGIIKKEMSRPSELGPVLPLSFVSLMNYYWTSPVYETFSRSAILSNYLTSPYFWFFTMSLDRQNEITYIEYWLIYGMRKLRQL